MKYVLGRRSKGGGRGNSGVTITGAVDRPEIGGERRSARYLPGIAGAVAVGVGLIAEGEPRDIGERSLYGAPEKSESRGAAGKGNRKGLLRKLVEKEGEEREGERIVEGGADPHTNGVGTSGTPLNPSPANPQQLGLGTPQNTGNRLEFDNMDQAFKAAALQQNGFQMQVEKRVTLQVLAPDLPDPGHLETARRNRRKVPSRLCDRCHLGQDCDAYSPGAVCAYEPSFSALGARDIPSVLETMRNIVGDNFERLEFAKHSERIANAGQISPEVTRLSETCLNQAKALLDLQQEAAKITLTAVGTDEHVGRRGSSILASLFGAKPAESNTILLQAPAEEGAPPPVSHALGTSVAPDGTELLQGSK